jgi:hypothetical protein
MLCSPGLGTDSVQAGGDLSGEERSLLAENL